MISLLDLCFYRATGMLHEMGGEKCLAFVFLWMTTQNLMTGALQVHLEPTSVLKHVNEHLELVCTALDCPGEAQFMWRGLLDTTIGGKMEWNQTTSRRVYSQLTVADEKTVICKVKCGVHKEARTKIQVYSFPSDPVISRWKASSLLCTVRSVYPFNWFTFNWLRGETRLTGREVSDVYKEGIQDIYSEYTPSEEDLGKNITCRVTLALAGVPKGHQVRSVTVQYGPASINISRNTTVKIGERLELKCDAEGQFNITWKKLEKNEATPLTTDKVIMIEKATLSHAGEYECEASNELASRRSTVGVIVKGPPNVPNIRLSQVGNPRAGDNVTIICDSDSVLPVLTISGASLNQVEKESSSVSVNLPSIQLRDSGIYHCEAKNELGSTRSSVTVTVHAPPMNSTVVVHPSAPVMEAQNVTIHCSTVSFPPASFTLKREDDGLEFASTNGIFHLFNLRSEDKGIYLVNFTNELGYETQTIHLVVIGPPNVPNIRLSQVGNPRAGDNVTIICDSDSVLPVLTISGASLNQVEKESSSVSVNLPSIQLRDSGIYHCEAKNELGSTRSSVTVTVHAPPMNSTVVVHPSAPVMEAQNVTIHCSTVSFPPASFTLKREDDGLEFASTNGIFHLFNLRSEDKGIYLVNFTNELGYETQTIHLVVIGPPNVPNIRLSQVGNPRAGDNVTIICDSDSVLPVLTISGASLNQVEKESSSVSVNLPSIQLRDSGIYHCEAKNELGSTRSSVTVTVHAPPMNSTVVVHPSAPVMEAQNVTIHCSTVSFPPASFTLKREDDGLEFASTNGIFHLFNLRSEDKGIYLVNFTNELGYETQTIHLVVIEGEASTLILTKAIVPSVSSISLLTAAALLIRHLRRAKKDSFGPSLGDALDL